MVTECSSQSQMLDLTINFLIVGLWARSKNNAPTSSLNSFFISDSSNPETFLTINLFAWSRNFWTQLSASISLSLVSVYGNDDLPKGVNTLPGLQDGELSYFHVTRNRPVWFEKFKLHRDYLLECLVFLATRKVRRDPLWPGTLPLTKTKFFSGSTFTTFRFWVVRLTSPIWPGIFLFLKTLPGHWQRP